MFGGDVVYTRSFMDRPPFDIMQNLPLRGDQLTATQSCSLKNIPFCIHWISKSNF